MTLEDGKNAISAVAKGKVARGSARDPFLTPENAEFIRKAIEASK